MLVSQTNQILMVPCNRCGADFATAHHTAERIDEQTTTTWIFTSYILCANEDCLHSARSSDVTSSGGIAATMIEAMNEYREEK